MHGHCSWSMGGEMSTGRAYAQGAFLGLPLLPVALHQAQLLSSTGMYKEGLKPVASSSLEKEG